MGRKITVYHMHAVEITHVGKNSCNQHCLSQNKEGTAAVPCLIPETHEKLRRCRKMETGEVVGVSA